MPRPGSFAESVPKLLGNRPLEYGLHFLVRASLELCISQEDLKDTKGCRQSAGAIRRKKIIHIGVSPSLSSLLPV